METFLTGFAIVAVVVATLGVGCFAIGLTWLLGKRKSVTTVDKAVIAWLFYNAVIHFTLEASFLYYSLTGTVNGASGVLADVWKEYAKADSRWGEADPTIVSLEILTVFFNGCLCLVLIHAIITNKPYRHFVQIVLNVCELYGGWMTFCPEWIQGSPSLDTSNWLYLWVYLVFFNGIWVVAPLLLLCQSFFPVYSRAKDKQN